MAQWVPFTGIVGVILVLLLVLARASATLLDSAAPSTPDDVAPSAEESTDSVDGPTLNSVGTDPHSVDETPIIPDETSSIADGKLTTADEPPTSVAGNGRLDGPSGDGERDPPETVCQSTGRQQLQPEPALSTPALLANVALSQGLFAVLLVVMAWYTEIPAWAFGLSTDQLTLGAVGTGVAVGGVFYGLNEAAAAVGRRQGMATPTGLREALAPETAAGWAVLLLVVLPIIAGFEELLFRGALIGVIHAGFGVSPWLLAVGSSVAFGFGHGAQGRLGIVVTGLLGIGLAAVFILTGSLGVVIVAHYVINSLEFVIHEGFELA